MLSEKGFIVGRMKEESTISMKLVKGAIDLQSVSMSIKVVKLSEASKTDCSWTDLLRRVNPSCFRVKLYPYQLISLIHLDHLISTEWDTVRHTPPVDCFLSYDENSAEWRQLKFHDS